ncbi:MAG: DUF3987 domain-containing protein, partial [Pseudomonadota bacterium]
MINDQFHDAMRGRGIIPPVQLIADGKIHRCDVEGKNGKGDGSYLLYNDGICAGGFQNWRDGKDWENWHSNIGREFTHAEKTAYKVKMEAIKKEREAETAKRNLDAQRQAIELLKASPVGQDNHPYLQHKQSKVYSGIKQGYWQQRQKDNCLLIPLQDSEGEIWNIQAIFPAKDDVTGRDKDFLFGGRKKGLFFPIGEFEKTICICEGYSTATSIYQAIGCFVIIAFDAGNLEAVAKIIKVKYPTANIIICADNDRFKQENTGVIKATQAATAINASLAIPEFADLASKPSDFNDLHSLEGLQEVKKQLQITKKWEAPIVFSELEIPEIPEILLPDNLQDYASSLTKAAEVSSGMVVAAILGILSVALCKKFVVSPKDGWFEPINIYPLVALPPASNKSLILKNVTFPLIEWEKEQKAIKEPEVKRKLSLRKSEEKIIEGMRTQLTKPNTLNKLEQFKQDIADKEASLSEIEYLPKLFGNNFTPESLADDVFEQGGKFAVISDEGGVLETLAGLYSSGNANVDIVLKGIDGGDTRIRRKTYNYNINPYLTFLLIVQPQILLNMNSKKAYTGNGMLERFLYVIPKSNLGYRTHETTISPQYQKDNYQVIIQNLLNLKDPEKPTILKLSPDALKDWQDFQKSIEHQLRPGGKLEVCVGWGGKICGFTLRLAGLIHVCETLGSNLEISTEAMTKALTLAGLLCDHAVAAFVGMGAEQSVKDAKDILKWIEELRQPSFSKS